VSAVIIKCYSMKFPQMKLTVEEVSLMSGLSSASVRQYIRKGILKANKIGSLRTSPYLVNFKDVITFMKVLRFKKKHGLAR